jgi:copper(I)-binding protein
VTRMTRRLLAGAIVVLIPVLAGCEAGLDAPTSQFHQAAFGGYTTGPGITVNNAFVLGAPLNQSLPAGSDAGVFLAVYASTAGGDTLTKVAAPGVAATATITGGTVTIPGSTSVNLTGPSPEIVLNDLSRPLSGGQDITLELTFATAGQVNVQVPVQPQAFAYSTYTQPAPPTPTPTATAAATTSPTGTATAGATSTASPTATASTAATHKKHTHASPTASATPSATP